MAITKNIGCSTAFTTWANSNVIHEFDFRLRALLFFLLKNVEHRDEIRRPQGRQILGGSSSWETVVPSTTFCRSA